MSRPDFSRLLHPKTLEELAWPSAEMLEYRKSTGHFDLSREILGALYDFELQDFLEDLFWYGLAQADWEVANACVDAGFKLVPETGDGWIHAAFLYLPGRPDVIQWLLKHGSDIERRGIGDATPLIAASRCAEDLGVLGVLVNHGADIEAIINIDEYLTPLMLAAIRGNFPGVRLLIEHGADTSRRSWYWNLDAADLAKQAGHKNIEKHIRMHESQQLEI